MKKKITLAVTSSCAQFQTQLSVEQAWLEELRVAKSMNDEFEEPAPRRRRGRPAKKKPEQVEMEEEGAEVTHVDHRHRREVNAQIRREFKKANFDSYVNNPQNDSHFSEEDQAEDEDDIDNKMDDDDFIDGLKKQHQKKQKEKEGNMEEVDLDKLTRRQKMAYLSKNNLLSRGQQFNLQSLDQQGNANEAGEEQDFSVGLPSKQSKRAPKTQLTQAQSDEIKRKQLEQILEEQNKKMQDRNDKLKGNTNSEGKAALIGGTLGRYVQHNTKTTLKRPGMEQFDVSIRTRITGESGTQVIFPKGTVLPECLRGEGIYSSAAAEQVAKAANDELSCRNCGVVGLGKKIDDGRALRKYKCSKTGVLTCSLECYKENLAKA